jgi:hypothetical protein
MLQARRTRLAYIAHRFLAEPPFRLFVRPLVSASPMPFRIKADWDAAARPAYLAGVIYAADAARRVGIPEISVIEFGVANGAGLLELQNYAAAAEKDTGVIIHVYGFDSASGLPNSAGDYRDHPDVWMIGDFPMDQTALQAKLKSRTRLILGDVAETVPDFVRNVQRAPVGFISIDVDLYTSTAAALQVLSLPGKRMLRRVPLYLDDCNHDFAHRFAGELLAVEEFNIMNAAVKIDIWRGLVEDRVFPEAYWLHQMYMAHDLDAISAAAPQRKTRAVLPG